MSENSPARAASPAPPTVEDLDAEHLRGVVASYRRLRWVIAVIAVLVVCGALVWLSLDNVHQDDEIARLQQIVSYACPFYRQVALDTGLSAAVRNTAAQSYVARGCLPPFSGMP